MADLASAACEVVTVKLQLTAVAKVVAAFREIPAAQRKARKAIAETVPSLGVDPLGETCTLWRPPVPGSGQLAMEPGVIVSRVFEPAGDVVPSVLPAGRAGKLVLKGGFEGIPKGWDALHGWCREQGYALANVNWEVYGPTPSAGDGATQETTLFALLA